MRKHSHSRTHKECKAKLSLSLSGHTKWRAHTHTFSHTEWRAHTHTLSGCHSFTHGLKGTHYHSITDKEEGTLTLLSSPSLSEVFRWSLSPWRKRQRGSFHSSLSRWRGTFSMKEWTMGAQLFTFSKNETARVPLFTFSMKGKRRQPNFTLFLS